MDVVVQYNTTGYLVLWGAAGDDRGLEDCWNQVPAFVMLMTSCSASWPWYRFPEIPFGNLRVWEGVEIMEILEIWGSGEVWKVEILEIWPLKCPISSRVEI